MTLPQDHLALIESAVRKRKFWLKMLCFSVVGVLLPPIIAFIVSAAGMKGAFGALGTSGADVGALAEKISTVLVSVSIGIGISALAFVLLLVSLVRFLMVPKVLTPVSL